MLHELQNVRQPLGEPFRRWFTSPECDLIVWYTPHGKVLGFQFCYDKRTRRQRAVQWDQDYGFEHFDVDDTPRWNPILEETLEPLPEDLPDRFARVSARLDEGLARFVHGKIREAVRAA